MDSEQREGERDLAANPNDPAAMVKVISNLYHTQGTEAAEAALDLWYLQKGEAIHEHLQQFDTFYADITTMVEFRKYGIPRRESHALESIARLHGQSIDDFFCDQTGPRRPPHARITISGDPISWPSHIRSLGLDTSHLHRPPQELIRLPYLLILDLSDTRLTTLQGLPNFQHLHALWLTYLKLPSLEGLPELPSLKSVLIHKSFGLRDDPMIPVLREREVMVHGP